MYAATQFYLLSIKMHLEMCSLSTAPSWVASYWYLCLYHLASESQPGSEIGLHLLSHYPITPFFFKTCFWYAKASFHAPTISLVSQVIHREAREFSIYGILLTQYSSRFTHIIHSSLFVCCFRWSIRVTDKGRHRNSVWARQPTEKLDFCYGTWRCMEPDMTWVSTAGVPIMKPPVAALPSSSLPSHRIQERRDYLTLVSSGTKHSWPRQHNTFHRKLLGSVTECAPLLFTWKSWRRSRVQEYAHRSRYSFADSLGVGCSPSGAYQTGPLAVLVWGRG